MRHMTLGDWYVERYESKAMGAAYTVFGILFYMVYGSMLFSAIGKVAAPLLGDTLTVWGSTWQLEYVLVPLIAIIVIVYGVLGGLTAAYWTDMVQGIFIIILSVILVPFGLKALVAQFGDPSTDGLMTGFTIMHQQLPQSLFQLVGSTNSSEFPLYRIVAVTVISLIGIVVQPHFIATGGGSAKTEFHARVGLVAGNLAKRFCTIGWAITALIVLTLYADNAEVMRDPDRAWGIASRELLTSGLRGLMLACLLAALMSSADTYMLVSAALIVRNLYLPYLRPGATEASCLRMGRLCGMIVIVGAALVSLKMMNVFQQLQLTWIVPVVFAAPFWVGLFWRRATTTASWVTIGFTVVFFFVAPRLIPVVMPSIKESNRFTIVTDQVTTRVPRQATPSDVRRRQMEIQEYERLQSSAQGTPSFNASQDQNNAPMPLTVGATVHDTLVSGGKSIYWSGGVETLAGAQMVVTQNQQDSSSGKEVVRRNFEGSLRGKGTFRLDFLIYDFMGIKLQTLSDSMLATLELPIKIVLPFLVMIGVSLVTRRNSKEGMDRYYSKMKTAVLPDPEEDRVALNQAYANRQVLEARKWFPGSDLEVEKPTLLDVGGFLITFLICFLIIGLAIWVATIGG
jgi:SSS family solute:Na+ symporter